MIIKASLQNGHLIMNSIKKRVLSTLIATGLIAGAAVPAFASVNVEGGTWDYGSKVTISLKKKAWSNYNHPTKYHGSSVSLGTSTNSSGKTAPHSVSYASITGSLSDTAHAHYKFYK